MPSESDALLYLKRALQLRGILKTLEATTPPDVARLLGADIPPPPNPVSVLGYRLEGAYEAAGG
jgi:hypothetical protein